MIIHFSRYSDKILRRWGRWCAIAALAVATAAGAPPAAGAGARRVHGDITDSITRMAAEDADSVMRFPELYYTNRSLLSAGDVWHSRDNLMKAAAAVDSLGFVPEVFPAETPSPAPAPLLPAMVSDYYASTGDRSMVRAMLPRLEREYATLAEATSDTAGLCRQAMLYVYERTMSRLQRESSGVADKKWERLASDRRSALRRSMRGRRGDDATAATPDRDLREWLLLWAGLADRAAMAAVEASVPAVAALVADSAGVFPAENLLMLLDGLGEAGLKDKADALALAITDAMSGKNRDEMAATPSGAEAALFETAYRRLYPSDAATDAVRVANVVCIVRASAPAHEGAMADTVPDRAQLLEASRRHTQMLGRYGVKGTYLVQFDAMADTAFTSLLCKAQSEGADIGAWFEISEPHAKAAGLKWESRSATDPRASLSLTAGYKPKDRERLADEYFKRFRDVFGEYPRSVGAPALDAHTAAYMKKKYGVEAFAIAADTESGARRLTVADAVDASAPVSLSGGYFQGGYFPSKRNIAMPAQTASEGIQAPVFRIPTPDPAGEYNRGAFSRRALRRMVNDLVYSPALGQVHIVATYPNYLPSADAEEELRYMVPTLARLAAKGDIILETMSESGRQMRGATSGLTPAAALTSTMAEDPATGQTASGVLRYASRCYRMALVCEPGEIYVRDIHLFDESKEEPHLTEPCIGRSYTLGTLPVVDGFGWSNDTIRAGMKFYTVDSLGRSARMRFGPPIVARTSGTFSVIVPVEMPTTAGDGAGTGRGKEPSRRENRQLRRKLGNAEVMQLNGDRPGEGAPTADDNRLQMVVTFTDTSLQFTLCRAGTSTTVGGVPQWYAAVEHAPGAAVPFAGAALTFDVSTQLPLPGSMADCVSDDYRYRISSPDAIMSDSSTRVRDSRGALRALTIVPDQSTITLNLSK